MIDSFMDYNNDSKVNVMQPDMAVRCPDNNAAAAIPATAEGNTVALQMQRDMDSMKVLHVLEESGVCYKAVASESDIQLFFQNRGLSGSYHGKTLCGITVKMAAGMDFLMPLDGPVETLHADEEYSMMPLWLEPVTDCGALKSGISPIGESEWVAYMKPVYKQALKNGGEAYALTIEAAKILNRYFREKPFQEKNMEEILNIMEMEMEMDDFYEEVTDRCNGKTKTVFQKDKFAEWFIKRYGLINLNYIEHRYNNGVYEPTTKSECCDLLHKYLKNTNATVKREVVQTIYSLLGIYASRTTSDAGRYYDLKIRCRPELIAFQNGIYDISTGEWSDFDPDIIITNRIHADYVDYSSQTGNGTKSSAMETVDSWLDSFSSGDRKKRAVLEEAKVPINTKICFYYVT